VVDANWGVHGSIRKEVFAQRRWIAWARCRGTGLAWGPAVM